VLRRTLNTPEVDRLYLLRRELLHLRKAVVPLVEVCQRLEHADVLPIDAQMQPLFRDVSDHIRRVQEDIDSLREVLAFAFEASLMAGQAQQNAIVRQLAAWAAILAVPTAVAGIYGMNFDHMPELKWTYGYYAVVGCIVSLCTLLYVRFRRNGWLVSPERATRQSSRLEPVEGFAGLQVRLERGSGRPASAFPPPRRSLL
jgi:magnesium transporter